MEKITAEIKTAVDYLRYKKVRSDENWITEFMEEYAYIKVEQERERIKRGLENLQNCKLSNSNLEQLDKSRSDLSKRHPEWKTMDKYSREQLQYCMVDFAKEYLSIKLEQFIEVDNKQFESIFKPCPSSSHDKKEEQ